MKISPKDLVKLLVESNNQGYNQAVKHADRNYDEFSADFREAINRAQDETQEIKRAMPEALAQAKSQAYEAGYAKGQEEAHKVGYQRGLAEGQARAFTHEEAYQSGYAQGLGDGRHAEITAALDALPHLSVWFKPCGSMPVSPSGEVLGYPPGVHKIDAIKAIREAYEKAEGYGLRDVKDLVEVESYGCRFAAGDPLPQSKAVTLYLALQAAGFDPVLKS